MKLSLILPIYNVEEYIPKCLDSIYAQGLDEENFEVISVVDGSPDNSIDVVNEHSKRHKNLVVIDTENGGVSSARNKGMEVAKGEYIMFIDPDDTLIAGSLKKIYTSLEIQEVDIAVLRSYNTSGNIEQFPWNKRIKPNVTNSGLEIYEKGYTRGGVWGVVYNKQFLNDNKLEFPLNIKNSEDAFFFMQCQILANRMIFLDIGAYMVFTRPGSASQDMSRERLSLWFNTLKLIKDFKSNSAKGQVEISMADGLTYSIISDITKNAIRTMGWNARKFLVEHNIYDFLPISNENVIRSNKASYIMKRIINISFAMYFCISYLRYKKT